MKNFNMHRWALESTPDNSAEWDVDARMAEAYGGDNDNDNDNMDERAEMDRDTTLYMLNLVRDEE